MPSFVPQKEKKMAKKVIGKIKLQIEAGKAKRCFGKSKSEV